MPGVSVASMIVGSSVFSITGVLLGSTYRVGSIVYSGTAVADASTVIVDVPTIVFFGK